MAHLGTMFGPAVVALAWSVLTLGLGSASAQDRSDLPLCVAVVREDGHPVVSRPWVRRQVEMANRIFASAGLRFAVQKWRTVNDQHARLENRSDRHALGFLLAPDAINVFVVKSLRDVDEPDRMRFGVHWRPRSVPGAHFVILSSQAPEAVLAHELGHFFGNKHSSVPNNIMSYERSSDLPFFNERQRRMIRLKLRQFLRRNEFKAVPDHHQAASVESQR